MNNYYKILGVSEDADTDTIKKAYRDLAKKYHPDKNKESGAEERFKEISEAYEHLGDPTKKNKYDNSRKFGGDFSDLFGGFYQNRQNQQYDPFAAHYGAYNQQPHKPQTKGTSLNITLQITLNEVLNGIEKKIKIKRDKNCKSCRGTGAEGGSSFQTCANCSGSGYFTINQNRGFVQINSVQVCGGCKGTGKVVLENCLDCSGKGLRKDEEIVEIKIPAGSSDGMQFVIEGKGDESRDGGKSGDLFVKIKETPDPVFIRKGIDLITSKQITFIDAVLGTNIDVIMPNGETVTTVVDPGTVPGTVLKFAQKGIPNMGYGGKGNFLVELNVKIPNELSEEQKGWLELQKNNEIFQ